MKNSLQLLITAFLLAVSTNADAQCADATAVYSFTHDGRTYEIIKENKTWVAAAACAVERGGHLAEINSAEEQDAIFAQITNLQIDPNDTKAPDGGNASYVWLGGNDILQEGKWIWDGNNDAVSVQFWQGTASGSAIGGLYNNWGDEPDNSAAGTGQDGLGLAIIDWPLGDAGQWNDVNHANQLYFVIEYDTLMGTDTVELPVVSVYPNPASDLLFINSDNGIDRIEITNAIGQEVRNISYISSDIPISLEDLKTGVYFVRLHFLDGRLAVKKIMKQ
jgi:hypothetical protein